MLRAILHNQRARTSMLNKGSVRWHLDQTDSLSSVYLNGARNLARMAMGAGANGSPDFELAALPAYSEKDIPPAPPRAKNAASQQQLVDLFKPPAPRDTSGDIKLTVADTSQPAARTIVTSTSMDPLTASTAASPSPPSDNLSPPAGLGSSPPSSSVSGGIVPTSSSTNALSTLAATLASSPPSPSGTQPSLSSTSELKRPPSSSASQLNINEPISQPTIPRSVSEVERKLHERHGLAEKMVFLVRLMKLLHCSGTATHRTEVRNHRSTRDAIVQQLSVR